MENINKMLLFITFALIYSSIIYLIGQKQETEIELDISNSLLNDLIFQKYPDGTYISEWRDTVKDGHFYLEKKPFCTDKNWTDVCTYPPLLISNQALNGTTHIRIKTPLSIADIIFAYL